MQLNKLLNYAFVLIILSVILFAQENFELSYSLKNLESKNEIKDVLVEITAINKNTEEEYTLTNYMAENKITIHREKGDYKIIIKVDNLDSDSKDFYYEDDINLDGNLEKEALLFSVGTLRGTVLDSLDNIVKADLKFECSKDYGEKKPKSTDKYGFFVVDYMPVGNCRIVASRGDSIGLADIKIEKGKVTDIQIKLNKSKKSSIFPI